MLPKGRNKLKLSNFNMLGMGPVMIKSLMEKNRVYSLDRFFQEAADLEIEITICEMSMDSWDLKKKK